MKFPKFLFAHPTVDAPVRPALSAVTSEHNLRMFGRRWIGNLTSEMEGAELTEGQIRSVIEGVHTELARYGNKLGTSKLESGPAGSLRTTNPSYRPEKEFGAPTSVEDIQKANEEFWAERADEPQEAGWSADRARTTDGLGCGASVSSIQKALDTFWDAQRALQTRYGAEFGKG